MFGGFAVYEGYRNLTHISGHRLLGVARLLLRAFPEIYSPPTCSNVFSSTLRDLLRISRVTLRREHCGLLGSVEVSGRLTLEIRWQTPYKQHLRQPGMVEIVYWKMSENT